MHPLFVRGDLDALSKIERTETKSTVTSSRSHKTTRKTKAISSDAPPSLTLQTLSLSSLTTTTTFGHRRIHSVPSPTRARYTIVEEACRFGGAIKESRPLQYIDWNPIQKASFSLETKIVPVVPGVDRAAFQHQHPPRFQVVNHTVTNSFCHPQAQPQHLHMSLLMPPPLLVYSHDYQQHNITSMRESTVVSFSSNSEAPTLSDTNTHAMQIQSPCASERSEKYNNSDTHSDHEQVDEIQAFLQGVFERDDDNQDKITYPY